MNERRLESRFLCADLIRVNWNEDSEPAGALKTAEAVLEDISPFGACVQVEESVPLGAPVTFMMGTREYSGDVTYCVFRDYGYFVGIRLRADSQWSLETLRHSI